MLLTLIICQSCFYWHKKSHIKINWGHHSCYGYGLARENLEREQQSASFNMEWYSEIGFVISTISYIIFGTNSSFHVEQRTAGRVWSLYFGALLLVLAQFLFCRGEGGGAGRWTIILWGLGTFLIFPNFLGS